MSHHSPLLSRPHPPIARSDGKGRLPFMKRSIAGKGASSSSAAGAPVTSDYEPGGALAAASGVAAFKGTAALPVGGGVTAAVNDDGGLGFQDGGEEGQARRK